MATLSLIGLSGCAPAPARDSERWSQAEQETRRQPAVSENAVEGKALNDFFPRVSVEPRHGQRTTELLTHEQGRLEYRAILTGGYDFLELGGDGEAVLLGISPV